MPAYDTSYFLPANDAKLSGPEVQQCKLGIAISAPDTPAPFEIALYRSDGTEYLSPTTISEFGVTVERPYDEFTDGTLILRIRDPNSCRASYDVHFSYTHWLARKYVPKLLYEPPLVNRIVPEFGDFPWMYPADDDLIRRGFLEPLGELPEQRVTFPWHTTGDFEVTVSIGGGRGLDFTLYDSKNQPIAQSGLLAQSADGSSTLKSIAYADLAAGWYAIGFHGGTFPTFFNVIAGGMHERTLLPIVQVE